jgi:hypothetical protein
LEIDIETPNKVNIIEIQLKDGIILNRSKNASLELREDARNADMKQENPAPNSRIF